MEPISKLDDLPGGDIERSSEAKTVGPPNERVVGCMVVVAVSAVMLFIGGSGANRLLHIVGYLLAGALAPVLGIWFRHGDRERKLSALRYKSAGDLQRLLVATLLVGVVIAVAHALYFAADLELG